MNFTDTITMYSLGSTNGDDLYWERFVIKGCQWREKIVRTTDSSGKVFKTKEISVTIPIKGDTKNRLFFDTKGKDIIVLGAPSKKRRLPTLPHCIAVPSAQVGLTSLFGMGRGGTPPL